MAYFTDLLLERKIEEYDLAPLDKVLGDLAADGNSFWPVGGYFIKAQPRLLESTRIVVYSMLHSYHLKSKFKVKINYDQAAVYIDMVSRIGSRVREGGMGLAGPSVSGHSTFSRPSAMPDAQQKDDFSFLGDDSTTFDEPDKIYKEEE